MHKMTTAMSVLGVAGAAALLLISGDAAADLEIPQESPPAKLSQQIGLTDVTLDYSSPAVRGRKIFGELVPYDKPWSISPNQPTTIRFSKDVVFGEKAVAAGLYRLYAIPAKPAWTLVLTRLADPISGLRDGKPDALTVRVKVPAKTSSFRERLTFFFSSFGDDKASLDLEWEKVRVAVPIAVNTSEEIAANIKNLEDAWRSYANAARYMLETKKDFDAGIKYADKSLALKEDWYTYWIKAALLAAKGDYNGAHSQGERAYQLGQRLGDGFVLEPELKKALADWSAAARGRSPAASATSAR
jgi:tetratricopeptide (TPR) repeat protein